jgi:6-phosphogluconolactonase
MNSTRRNALKLVTLSLTLGSLAVSMSAYADDDDGFRSGKVFTSTNSSTANELLVFAPDATGQLSLITRLATQGQGTGGGLGNQGSVTLSGNGRYLFVTNAQSNTVSTFQIRNSGITLTSTVNSGGLRPISVTEHRGVVYVLNASGTGNVAGFSNHSGVLTPIAGSIRGLSATTGTGSAQVGFSPDGEVLVVTEKATNKLTSYRVRGDGGIDEPVVTASAGITPFGFAFDRRGDLLVSEAFGGAANASAVSSYTFSSRTPATPSVVSPSVGTTQSAACWVVVTPNGRYAYTTNTASGTISSYTIAKTGAIALAEGQAATAGAGPIDAAISANGRSLYVLNARSQTISSFTVGRDGILTNPGSVAGLPVGAVGMAAN